MHIFLLPITASLADWDFADPPALLALQKYSPDCSLFKFFRTRLFLYLYKEGSSSEPLWYLPGRGRQLRGQRLTKWPEQSNGLILHPAMWIFPDLFPICCLSTWHHLKVIPLPLAVLKCRCRVAGRQAGRQSCQLCLLRFCKLVFVCFSSESLGR